jgi:anti-sigma B factor antagonist
MVVPAERHPVVWVGRTAVVSLPAEIDIANADQVREDLLSVVNEGAVLLVVDMSTTTFCDSAGVNAVVRTFKRAIASGAGMRLVVTAPAVQRILAITGVDHLIDIYGSVAAAVATVGQRGPAGKASGHATTHTGDADSGDCTARPGLAGLPHDEAFPPSAMLIESRTVISPGP